MTDKEIDKLWKDAINEKNYEQWVKKMINITPIILNKMADIYLDKKNEVKSNDN